MVPVLLRAPPVGCQPGDLTCADSKLMPVLPAAAETLSPERAAPGQASVLSSLLTEAPSDPRPTGGSHDPWVSEQHSRVGRMVTYGGSAKPDFFLVR